MNSQLKEITLFSYFSDEEISALAKIVHKKIFPKNTIIFSQGDDPDSLYVVLKGNVWILLNNIHGKELVLNIHEEGDYFGEMALIDDEPRSATAMTKEEVQVLVISNHDFRKMLRSNHDMVLNILKGQTKRFRKATEKIEDFAHMDVYGRIVRVLNQRAKPVGEKFIIEEKFTHQEIANMVGATREMVSKILKKVSDAGYITIKDKHIEIHHILPFSS